MSIPNGGEPEKIRVSVTLDLTKETLMFLDKLKSEYGAASRGRVVEMLLQDLLNPEE